MGELVSYTYPSSGANSQLDRLRRDVDGLEDLPAEVDQLKEKLDELETEHSQGIERLETELRDTTETADTAAADVESVQQDLRRLTARVAWLERRSQLAEGEEAVALDAVNATMRRQLQALSAASRARLPLLPDQEYQRLTYQVQRYRDSLTRLHQARTAALQASETLAETAVDSPEHQDAATRYRTATAEIGTHNQAALNSRAAAEAARPRLEADDHNRAQAAPVLAAGTEADAALHQNLRTRLAEAVSNAALLPLWFTTALGPMPTGPNTQHWIDTATEALLYRITYKVDDQVVLLGPKPTQPGDRRAQYDQLTRDVRRAY
jgi:chromosome segregation ATPase